MRTSLSLDSDEVGKGAEMGVYVEYAWLRFGSPDPYCRGDSISLVARCFSNSNGVGLVRLLFPDEDSDPCSTPICCCGVIAGANWEGADGGGVRSCGRGSGPSGDGSGGAVMDCLPLLGGGYTSPRAAASCALCCASAFVGLPRFFLFAGSPDGFIVDV